MTLPDLRARFESNPWHSADYYLYEFENSPADAPWRVAEGESISRYIYNFFSPVRAQLTELTRLISQRCQELFLLKIDETWLLIYSLMSTDGAKVCYLVGGAPTDSPALAHAAIISKWHIPPELVRFYQLHNGFGALQPLGSLWSYESVVPDHKLAALSAYFPWDIALDLPYHSDDLLHFFPDGSGNGQYFYRPYMLSEEQTVDWDHETRELSKRENFWRFVDRRLSRYILRSITG